jgi:hypothetical protein
MNGEHQCIPLALIRTGHGECLPPITFSQGLNCGYCGPEFADLTFLRGLSYFSLPWRQYWTNFPKWVKGVLYTIHQYVSGLNSFVPSTPPTLALPQSIISHTIPGTVLSHLKISDFPLIWIRVPSGLLPGSREIGKHCYCPAGGVVYMSGYKEGMVLTRGYQHVRRNASKIAFPIVEFPASWWRTTVNNLVSALTPCTVLYFQSWGYTPSW